jgi:hypothetical protein
MELKAVDLLRRTRRLIDDLTPPYWYEDGDLFALLNEAEHEFAKRTECLRGVITWTTEAGQDTDSSAANALGTIWLPNYQVDSTSGVRTSGDIRRLRRATYQRASSTGDTSKYPLSIGGLQTREDQIPEIGWDYGITLTAENLQPGYPRAILMGRKTGYIELLPEADDVYTIEADVILLPFTPIEQGNATPTISQEWHQLLPYGAAIRALRGARDEMYNPKRLDEYNQVWEGGLNDALTDSDVVSADHGRVDFTADVW